MEIINIDEALTLNVLLTKKCSANCKFCVENTVDKSYARDANLVNTIEYINMLIANKLVTDVLLLGGEPFDYPYLLEVIENIEAPSIITSNALKLCKDESLLYRFSQLKDKIKAINLSVCHYDQNKRAELMQVKKDRMYTNDELKKVVSLLRSLGIPVRANVLMIKDYIDCEEELNKMIEFCENMGFSDIKFGELTARNEEIHYFIRGDVLEFNRTHYVPVPIKELYDKCHNIGGTYLWKKTDKLSVYFNAAPDKSISGGLDIEGKIYHRVLFCDEMIGNSWNREDGICSVKMYIDKAKKRVRQ